MKVKSLFESSGKTVGSLVVDRLPVTKDGKPRARWKGNFDCQSEGITSLEGSPIEIEDDFFCYDNQLTGLKGGPKVVGGAYYAGQNMLTSLEGAPESVGSYFDVTKNPTLKSISGIHNAVKEIGLAFWCDDVTHVLGLCLIKRLTRVTHGNKKVDEILNRHLGQGRAGLCDAHEELVDAGLEEYAKL